MSGRGPRGDPAVMHILDRSLTAPLRRVSTGRRTTVELAPPSARDPANELYDHACDLLVAAQGIRSAASRPGSVPGVAAAMGCIEASLEALAAAASAMRRESGRRLDRRGAEAAHGLSGVSPETLQREFSELVDSLNAADRAAGSMRERVGPILAQLTVV